jgi:integrase
MNITDKVRQQRGHVRPKGNRLELRAYAGVNPVTGRADYLSDTLAVDATEKQIIVALTTLVGRADDLAATRKRRRKEGGHAPPVVASQGERTVGAILEAWYEAHARHLASASTARTHLDSYLLPKLADVAAWRVRGTVGPEEAAIDPDLFSLAAFFDGLLASGSVGSGKTRKNKGQPLDPGTVGKTKRYLAQAFDQEIRRPGSTLTANPCATVRLPGVEDRESTTPEPDELEVFLPFLLGTTRVRAAHTVTRKRKDGTPYTFTIPARVDREAADRAGRQLLAFALLVASGPRPQEVAALQRGQLDRTTGRLALEGVGVVDGKVCRGETDKRRRRVIKLGARALAAVNDHLRAQDELALMFGKKLTRRSYMFATAPDCLKPVDPDGPSQAFSRIVEKAVAAGIPVPEDMRLYDMRHYGISTLLRKGKDPAGVAKRFGTSTTMLHQRYEHCIPGDDDGLADTLDDAWGDELGAPEGDVIPLG